jgi:hypothetical protein
MPTEGRCLDPSCTRFWEHGAHDTPSYVPPAPSEDELERRRQVAAEAQRRRDLADVARAYANDGFPLIPLDANGRELLFHSILGEERRRIGVGLSDRLFSEELAPCVSLALFVGNSILLEGDVTERFYSQFVQGYLLPETVSWLPKGAEGDCGIRIFTTPDHWNDDRPLEATFRGLKFTRGTTKRLDVYLHGRLSGGAIAKAPQELLDALQGAR